MKSNLLLTSFLLTIMAVAPFLPLVKAQEPDNTATVNEFKRREENLGRLDIEDQLKVRAAQQKALEDEGMKAALQKRDQAIIEFRAKLREKMIAADPSVKPILDRIAEGADPGFGLGR